MAQAEGYFEGAAPAGGPEPYDDQAIIPRDIHFGISANPTRHWNGGDPIKTLVIDGFSIFLPEGERFFIRSLKHYAATLEDKPLAREINGYAMQEAFHTREHEDYNRSLIALGYDVKKMERPIQVILGSVKQPVMRLAITCAIEHLTATFASSTLRHPEVFSDADPRYRRLWMWHALEELEHKAVALHVFRSATKDTARWKRYLLRVMAMNSVLVPFIVIYVRNSAIFARHDGLKTGPRFWARFARTMLFNSALRASSLGMLLRYYWPGFDPNKTDDSQLIERTRVWLAQELSGLDSATPAPTQ
ncbi:MAG: metal-dependent hydrolase [Beijerinckiaceae bacterium]|nr:metal-dependent hydrolase [Beijerinckiaceae bacterium]